MSVIAILAVGHPSRGDAQCIQPQRLTLERAATFVYNKDFLAVAIDHEGDVEFEMWAQSQAGGLPSMCSSSTEPCEQSLPNIGLLEYTGISGLVTVTARACVPGGCDLTNCTPRSITANTLDPIIGGEVSVIRECRLQPIERTAPPIGQCAAQGIFRVSCAVDVNGQCIPNGVDITATRRELSGEECTTVVETRAVECDEIIQIEMVPAPCPTEPPPSWPSIFSDAPSGMLRVTAEKVELLTDGSSCTEIYERVSPLVFPCYLNPGQEPAPEESLMPLLCVPAAPFCSTPSCAN